MEEFQSAYLVATLAQLDGHEWHNSHWITSICATAQAAALPRTGAVKAPADDLDAA